MILIVMSMDNFFVLSSYFFSSLGTAVEEIEKRLQDMTVKEQSNTQKLKKKGK